MSDNGRGEPGLNLVLTLPPDNVTVVAFSGSS